MTDRKNMRAGALHAYPLPDQRFDHVAQPEDSELYEAEAQVKQLSELYEQAEKIKASIDAQRVTLGQLEAEIEALSKPLLELSERTGYELNSGYYSLKVRYVKGRQSVSWDGARLAELLPRDLGKLVLTEVTTWQADGTLLSALAESGKLPEQAFEARTVKPGVNRFKVERIP